MAASMGELRRARGANAHFDFVDRLFPFDSSGKENSSSRGNRLICCAPHLAAHPCRSPSPGPALAPARVPCLAVVCPDLAPSVPAPDVGQRLAVEAGSDAGLAAVAGPDAGLTRLALVACPEVRCPMLASLAPAADAGPAADLDAGSPVVEAPAWLRAFEHLHPPFAAVVRAGPVQRFAGPTMAAETR